MTNPIGVLSDMGARVQTAFRTAVDVTDRIPYTSESLTIEFERLEQEALLGVGGKYNADQGVKSSSGTIETNMVYTDKGTSVFLSADQLLYWAMGTCTWDAGVDANRLTIQDDLARFGTIAIDKQTTIWEALGCYVKSFSLTCPTNGFLTGSFELQAYNLIITGAENEAAQFSALPDLEPRRILGCHQDFYIASDFGNALAAGDKIGVSNWTLNFDRGLSDNEYETVQSSGHTVCAQPIQPVINGFRTVTLEFDLLRYAADTYQTAFIANTMMQAKIDFTHPTTSERFIIYMPHLRITNAGAPVTGAGMITQKIQAQCFLADTTYDVMDFTGAVAVTKEVAIELINERTATIA